MVAPPLNLCVTSSSSSRGVLGAGGPLSSRGSLPNLPPGAPPIPVWSSPGLCSGSAALQKPRTRGRWWESGGGGPVPLGLAGPSGGAVSEGCPRQRPLRRPPCPPRGEGPVPIPRGYPVSGGLSGREPARDEDTTAVRAPFFFPVGGNP